MKLDELRHRLREGRPAPPRPNPYARAVVPDQPVDPTDWRSGMDWRDLLPVTHGFTRVGRWVIRAGINDIMNLVDRMFVREERPERLVIGLAGAGMDAHFAEWWRATVGDPDIGADLHLEYQTLQGDTVLDFMVYGASVVPGTASKDVAADVTTFDIIFDSIHIEPTNDT